MLTQSKETRDAWRASQRTLDIKVTIDGKTYYHVNEVKGFMNKEVDDDVLERIKEIFTEATLETTANIK